MKVVVCCPSYKRPKVETLDYLPFCRVYVDGSEYDEYVKANPKGDIVKCDDRIQGNLCRVRNYILKKEFKKGADVVLLIDDDLKALYYWEKSTAITVATNDFVKVVERYSLIAMEWGAKFWGVNINSDKQVYREYSPFSTTSYIGGPFQCFIKGNECFFDERLPLKEDYDMTLQQLNKYRIALRINKYHYSVKQAKQKGGCATFRNIKREKEQLKLLQKKWGAKIIKEDSGKSRSHSTKKIQNYDINPIMKAPIKGI